MTTKLKSRRLGIAANLSIWFCGASIVMVAVVSQGVDILASSLLSRQSGEKLEELAYQLTTQLDQDMYERYREIQLFANRTTFTNEYTDSKSNDNLLLKFQQDYPLYTWIGITNEDGKVIASTSKALTGKDVSNKPWFQNAKKMAYVSDINAIKLNDSSVLYDEPLRFIDVAFPYYGKDNVKKGIMGVHMNLEWAKQEVKMVIGQAQSHSKVEAMIVNNSGVVIAGPNDQIGKKISPVILLHEASKANHFEVKNWTNGDNYLVGLSSMRGFRSYPGLNWSVLVRQKTSDAFMPIRELRKSVIPFSIVLAVLFSLFGVYTAKRVTHSIRYLSIWASKVMRGEAKEFYLPEKSYPEVVQLGTSLNSLLKSRERDQESLRELNISLEERVRQRTLDFESSENRLRTIANNVPALIAYVNKDGKYEFCNSTYKTWFGISAEKIIGFSIEDIVGAEEYKTVLPNIRKVLSGKNVSFDIARQFNGSVQYIHNNFICDIQHGIVNGFYVLAQDVTSAKGREIALERAIEIDGMTDLLNRHGFMKALETAMARARRSGNAMALMFLDIDKFKEINDNYSHAMGDKILVEFARRLKSSVRETDTAARLAGDEFVLIVENLVHGQTDARLAAKKVIDAISKEMNIGEFNKSIGSSIGIAMYLTGPVTATTLLHQADQAMYLAKKDITSNFVFFTSNQQTN
jgi:diguanylate cyclase (GGDEF)-like protein/PAS domain S-box-containing protein